MRTEAGMLQERGYSYSVGRKAGDPQREMAGALPKSVYDSMRWLWTFRENFISGHQHMTYWLQNLLSSRVTTQRSISRV